MKQLKISFLVILVTLLRAFPNYAQVADRTTHFESSGVAFDYPADWLITDNSTHDVLSLALFPKYSLELITVIAQNLPTELSCDIQSASRKITDGLVKEAALKIEPGTPVHKSTVRTQVGGTEIVGVQLRGRLISDHQATTEIYSTRRNLQVVTLVRLRMDEEVPRERAWETIRRTLTIAGLGPIVVGTNSSKLELTTGKQPVTAVVISNKVGGVQPPYPPLARMAHASGKVIVQVLIDESGKVIAAQATGGHPLLQPAAVAAAKASRFQPTRLCGKPVQVAGIIQYNFLAQ